MGSPVGAAAFSAGFSPQRSVHSGQPDSAVPTGLGPERAMIPGVETPGSSRGVPTGRLLPPRKITRKCAQVVFACALSTPRGMPDRLPPLRSGRLRRPGCPSGGRLALRAVVLAPERTIRHSPAQPETAYAGTMRAFRSGDALIADFRSGDALIADATLIPLAARSDGDLGSPQAGSAALGHGALSHHHHRAGIESAQAEQCLGQRPAVSDHAVV